MTDTDDRIAALETRVAMLEAMLEATLEVLALPDDCVAAGIVAGQPYIGPAIEGKDERRG